MRGNATEIDAQRGEASARLNNELSVAFDDVWFREAKQRGLMRVKKALAKYPLDSIPPLQRPYAFIAVIYAIGGQPAQARAALSEREHVIPLASQRFQQRDINWAQGEIALAEHRPSDALPEFRKEAVDGCPICPLPDLGRAFDAMGNADSSIASFEAFLKSTSFTRRGQDIQYRAGIYKRLGELYETRVDTTRAVANYAAFADYWKDADSELQPRVAQVRQRLARPRNTQRH